MKMNHVKATFIIFTAKCIGFECLVSKRHTQKDIASRKKHNKRAIRTHEIPFVSELKWVYMRR